jgi:hypothetical protein
MIRPANIKFSKSAFNGYSLTKLITYTMLRLIVKTGAALVILFGMYSCGKPEIVPNFKDQDKFTIYDYIVLNKEKYSSF